MDFATRAKFQTNAVSHPRVSPVHHHKGMKPCVHGTGYFLARVLSSCLITNPARLNVNQGGFHGRARSNGSQCFPHSHTWERLALSRANPLADISPTTPIRQERLNGDSRKSNIESRKGGLYCRYFIKLLLNQQATDARNKAGACKSRVQRGK